MKNIDALATEIAIELYEWMVHQSYGGECLLHASVCCDTVGVANFKHSLKDKAKLVLIRNMRCCTEDSTDSWEGITRPFKD